MSDMVNSPTHYAGQGKIECIEYIEDHLSPEEYIGYLRGNIAKYNHRWRYKGGLQDLSICGFSARGSLSQCPLDSEG